MKSKEKIGVSGCAYGRLPSCDKSLCRVCISNSSLKRVLGPREVTI